MAESAAASSLRAAIRFDNDQLGSAPGDDVVRFVNELFASAIQKWIGWENSRDRVLSLVENLGGLALLPSIPSHQIETFLLNEIAATQKPSRLSTEAKLQTKMAVIIGLVERHGIYDIELDRWLLTTERKIEEVGYLLARP